MDEGRITENERRHYENHKNRVRFQTPEEEREWARTQRKRCTKCHETFPLSCFSGNTSGTDPFDQKGYRLRRPECRVCTKKANKGKYEAVKKAREKKPPEGTPCEICGTTQNIIFDHDHVTNMFRGWLCDPCNRSMGVFGDSVEGLQRAINYLQKPRAPLECAVSKEQSTSPQVRSL